VILLLNGAFGVGKTTVARSLVRRLPRAVLFDPEIIGIALQRGAHLAGRKVDDFQDLPSWRRLTIIGLRTIRLFYPNIVVPMAFSKVEYLQEIRSAIGRFEPRVLHFCLVAPVEVVHERLRLRGADPVRAAWEYRRATECCIAHKSEEFARHIATADRDADEIAEELLRVAVSSPGGERYLNFSGDRTNAKDH
jgi:predicted kinase